MDLKAVRYQSLDDALEALGQVATSSEVPDPLRDGREEPQGLLAVIPADRLPEDEFYRLLDLKKGVLVDVEKIVYSGYGPPAQEDDYMGFVGVKLAYVLKGCRLAIEIHDCPQGAADIHHLEALVLEGRHSLDRLHLGRALSLPEEWDFEDLFSLIVQGQCSGDEIDRIIHRGI